MLKKTLFALMLLLISFYLVRLHNRRELVLTLHEKQRLRETFGDLDISDSGDVIRIQNSVIDSIRHGFVRIGTVSVDTTLKNMKGECYDRSILLQKIFLSSGLEIRPVYVYYRSNGKTRLWDLFAPGTYSHNIFEAMVDGRWVVIQTNERQSGFQSLDDFIQSGKTVPTSSRYVRYLNNRNSRFIAPDFIPDIY